MKYCQKCAKQFNDESSICNDDGSRLVDERVVKQYKLMAEICNGAMSKMLGNNNIDGFFDFDISSWEALASKSSNDPRVDKFRIIAPVIFNLANQSALHFYDDFRQEDSPNHLDALVEFICLYAVLLKKTVISNTGFIVNSWSVWSEFLNSLKSDVITNLNLDETQSQEFWTMFTDLLHQRERLYKKCSLKYRYSWDDSSDDIFSMFGRVMSKKWRRKQKNKSVASAAIAAAVIGLNVVPKVMDTFMDAPPSSKSTSS